MPARIALTLDQHNDEDLTGTVLDETTEQPQNLTGVALEMLLKPSRETADDAETVTVLSTQGGQITVTTPAAGAYTVAVPASALAVAGVRWYRVDAVTGTDRKTVVYGPLKVRDL